MGWTYTLHELAHATGATDPSLEGSFSAVSTDTRTLEHGQVFFALKGENFDGNRFAADALAQGAVAAVVSEPQGPGPYLVVDDVLAALGRFAAWHRTHLDVPVLAVTGSCGKTTSKELIAAVLSTRYRVVKTRGNLNNEIGCPLSVLRMDETTEFGVIEMGANHAGEIARLCAITKPTESAITMIAPAHLEGFGSLEAVAAAKAEIMEGLPGYGVFYVNADDPRCVAIGNRFKGIVVRFGQEGDVALKAAAQEDDGSWRLVIEPIGEIRLPLPSRAHATNVLLAVAAGLRHGIDEFEAPLRDALLHPARFKIFTLGPITVMDDCYNANPASVRAALEALGGRRNGGRRLAALGDMLELGPDAVRYHEESGEWAAKAGVSYLVARGDYAHDTIRAARAAGVPHVDVIEDHHAMAESIHQTAQPGDIVLVKGSRGMRMERVIERLKQLYEA